MEEVWEEITGYNGLYQASNLGRVRSTYMINNRYKFKTYRYKILKAHKSNSGYLQLNLKGVKHYIHKLIATTFIDNLSKKREVNHIDGNKENNSVANLEWVNASENQKHAYKTGLKKGYGVSGIDNKRSISVNMIDINTGEVVKKFNSLSEAKKFLNKKSCSNLCRVLRKKEAIAYGYKWEKSIDSKQNALKKKIEAIRYEI